MAMEAPKGVKLLECSAMDIPEVNEEALLQASALRMAFSIVNPFLLKCALRLKIPDIIWRAGLDSPLSVQQIASQLPSEAPDLDALSRILACLSCMGILKSIKPTEDADLEIKGAPESMTMKYTLTNLTKTYFVSEEISPLSLAPVALLTMSHPVLRQPWDHIPERVLHVGDNFKNSCGDGHDFWSYVARNSDANNLFNAAMLSLTKVDMREILTYDGFKDVKTLVDLGGGHGEVITQIIALYPHIHAINFDLPHVIATAPTLPGITHISGNMFENVPFGDAILMKRVLHLWDDEDCIKLLKMCYKATSHKGKLIIIESVLDITEDSDPIGSGQLMDITMLNVFPGARERTQKQWNEILQLAGFSLSKIVGRKRNLTKIIEALKC